jgi:hypothetical protein
VFSLDFPLYRTGLSETGPQADAQSIFSMQSGWKKTKRPRTRTRDSIGGDKIRAEEPGTCSKSATAWPSFICIGWARPHPKPSTNVDPLIPRRITPAPGGSAPAFLGLLRF